MCVKISWIGRPDLFNTKTKVAVQPRWNTSLLQRGFSSESLWPSLPPPHPLTVCTGTLKQHPSLKTPSNLSRQGQKPGVNPGLPPSPAGSLCLQHLQHQRAHGNTKHQTLCPQHHPDTSSSAPCSPLAAFPWNNTLW